MSLCSSMQSLRVSGGSFAGSSARLGPAPCAPRRACCGVTRAMADGDKPAAPTVAWPKISDLRAMNDTVIVLEIEQLKKDLLLLNVKKATKQEVKCHQFVVLRKKVAMLKTIRRERELEQGIKKRESRKIDRALRQTKTTGLW